MSDRMPVPGPLPSPPFIDVAGIANFRDIGGHRIASTDEKHHSIRRNLIFRCADPTRIQPEGIAKLQQLGVKKIFDLRSEPEVSRKGPPELGPKTDDNGVFVTRDSANPEPLEDGQIERIWCPVFADTDYGPEKVAIRYSNYAKSGSEGFVKAYTDILQSGAAGAYKTILTHLSSEEAPSPCIVHCTAGKDRTGVLVALLLLVCGVDVDTVAGEYALTDEGLRHLVPLFTARLLENPALRGDEQGVRNMISSRAENMVATVGMIGERFGGVEGYLLETVGLSREGLARLRRNLVVEDKAVFME